jgi:C2 domain
MQDTLNPGWTNKMVLYYRFNDSLIILRPKLMQDTLNPVWRKKLVLEYRFEERQILIFKVFDRDSPTEDLQVGAVIKIDSGCFFLHISGVTNKYQ